MQDTNPVSWIKLFEEKASTAFDLEPGLLIREKNEQIKFILNELSKDNVTRFIHVPIVEQKSPEISSYFRLQGKNCFASKPDAKYLQTSYELHTKSLVYAPAASPELSLSYGARSEVFFKAKLIVECVQDIDRALEIQNCPEEIKAELNLTRAMCWQILDEPGPKIFQAFEDARSWVKKINTNHQDSMMQRINKAEEQIGLIDKSIYSSKHSDESILKLEKENPNFPGVSDALEMKYNEKFGRHFVATRDIKPGESLMIHRPYVSVLFSSARYKNCWHCGDQTWACLPCDTCTKVVFCSKICQQEALKEYHDIECPVLERMLEFHMDSGFQIDLQLAIKGFKESGGSLGAFKELVDKIDNEPESLTRGFTNNKMDPTKFGSVYGMSTKLNVENSMASYYLINNIVTACLLVTETNFAGERMSNDLEMLKEDPRFIFLVKLLNKNTYLTDVNSHEITVFTEKNNAHEPSVHSILPLAYCNHSCFKTLTKIFLNGYIIVKTLLPIKQGEDIFDNYGPNCFENTRAIRQKHLLRYYNFICQCEACENNWPVERIEEKLSSNVINEYNKINEIYNRIVENSRAMGKAHFEVSYAIKDAPTRTVDLLRDDLNDIVKIIEFCYSNCSKFSIELYNTMECLRMLVQFYQKPDLPLTIIS